MYKYLYLYSFISTKHINHGRRLHDFDLGLPPILDGDFLVLGDGVFGDALFGVRGTVLDKVYMAVLQNAGCNRQFGDCVGPVHLQGRIIVRRFGVGCIENLFIAH
jgi:hypothetical protein